MNYGFIYCLGNECMPGVYKIGMSGRSPRARCDELSSATGVPAGFQLLLYGDVEDMRASEAAAHNFFDCCRISENREFFRADIQTILDYFQSESESFCVTNEGKHALMVSDHIARLHFAPGPEERAKALTDLAFIEGVRIWAEDGVIQYSVPDPSYMTYALYTAVAFAGPLLVEHLSSEPFIPKQSIQFEEL